MDASPSSNRDARFQRIKEYFAAEDAKLAREGKLPLGSTEKGFWGTSHLDDVYAFCTLIALDTAGALIDLGSGDGRAIFVMALFTRVTGVEYDAKLHGCALAASRALGFENDPQVTLLCADYTLLDLTPFAVWYTYADHNFNWLEHKRSELLPGHVLYTYHDTYRPVGLTKEKTLWIGQVPVFSYTNGASRLPH